MNPITPKLASLTNWKDLSGMSRSTTYIELKRGNLRAVKLGKRTLIDVDAGLEWLRSLPAYSSNISA